MGVFNCDSYKEFIRAYLSENKQKGVVSRLAVMCGCDRTYLSQVLSDKAELTPDHILQLSEALNLDDTESRYLLLLLLRDRSASEKVRRALQGKLNAIQGEVLALTNQIIVKEKPLEISETMKTLYYSSWLYGAVHTLTSIPHYQSVASISARLNISAPLTIQVLKDLLAMGLFTWKSDQYKHNGRDIYLSSDSAQSSSNHLNWRMRAVERSRVKEDVHYSVAFSVSKRDLEVLRSQVLKFIENQRKYVRESGTDVAAAFCCDFFSF